MQVAIEVLVERVFLDDEPGAPVRVAELPLVPLQESLAALL